MAVGTTALLSAPILSIACSRFRKRKEKDKMKNGIRAIETLSSYYHTGSIKFEFVTGDDVKEAANPPKEGEDFVRSKCIVRVGDFDAVSGQTVTEDMIADYNKDAWCEIKNNLRYEKDDFTEAEEARREEIGKAFMITFRQEHGYDPSEDDVCAEMNRSIPERWNVQLRVLERDEERTYSTDHNKILSIPSKEMNLFEKSPEMQAIADVVASLDEREKDVWKVMFLKIVGGKVRPRLKEVADKWDLTPGAITKIKKKIKRMMQKRAEELRGEEIC